MDADHSDRPAPPQAGEHADKYVSLDHREDVIVLSVRMGVTGACRRAGRHAFDSDILVQKINC
jgi:hypothetical protein